MMRFLHLTFHSGPTIDLEYIAAQLKINIVTERFTDGVTKGNAIYNIGHKRAKDAWDRYKDHYNSFDGIITSDTAPIARVFLQNGYIKPLIVWVCNRFDYADKASDDCNFPDVEFYDLFRKKYDNVKIVSYTPFEHWYAANMRSVNAWSDCIRPIGKLLVNDGQIISSIPSTVIKKNTFFVPPYHNDSIFMDLSAKLTSLKISNYRGRYYGPRDLVDFKGIIHIPYAWSNFALFENLQNNMIYFIPSRKFILELSKQPNFFWTPQLIDKTIDMAEWYHADLQNVFVYFDGWTDLVTKINSLDYDNKKKQIAQFMENHTNNTLKSWKTALLCKSTRLEKYKDYLEKAISYYYPDDVFAKYYGSVPLFRYHSFKYCIDRLTNAMIVELGTSRSFVDGRFEGCNSDDKKYWNPADLDRYDWSAGCFTRVFSTCLPASRITTVDIAKNHIERCKHMNSDLTNIQYCVSSSEDFLNNMKIKADLIYMDTGDMTPIESTANLQLREAIIIVQKDLINRNGMILIDDVKNPTPMIAGESSTFGKAKYSIPYFLANGYHIVFEGYQVILMKN